MIFPVTAPTGSLVPLGTSLSRALDVFHGMTLLLPNERLAAGSMLQEFAQRTFGLEAPETKGVQDLYGSLLERGGEITDREALRRVFQAWEKHEDGEEEEDEPVTRTYAVAPIFEAGPVRFYQSPDVRVPLRRGQIPATGTVGGGHLLSNERNFHRYFDKVRDKGGVAIGLGSLQNLDLAVAAGSSGLILADINPTVSMTLALLLPQLALCGSPADFQEAAESMIRRNAPLEPFLEPIPEAYRPAFEAHLVMLRNSLYSKQFRKYLMSSLVNPYSFLGSQASFERAADLVALGGVSLLYGNFFGEDMPNLVELAMDVYQDPIRVLNVTNAPEQITARRYPVSAGPFLKILEAPHADPDGRLLMSTEFGNAATRGADPFRYHSVSLRASSILLRAYGHLAPFVRRFELSQGI